MGLLWKRLIIFLVFVIAVLQVIHMILLSRLESKRSERQKRTKNNIFNEDVIAVSDYKDEDIESDRKAMHEMVKHTTVLDSSGEYHIINFFSRAQSLGPRNHVRQDISLVTQTSVSQIYNLDLLSNRWHGLASVTVFALFQDIPLAIEMILLLRRCYPSIRRNTSFHLVYPLSIPKPAIGATTLSPRLSISIITKEENCDRMQSLLKMIESNAVNYGHLGIAYPNNLLRNVARRNALTDYVFVVDIDLVPNDGLYEQFIEFAKQNKLFTEDRKKEKVVYVVPAYEVNTLASVDIDEKLETIEQLIPKDKSQLLRQIELMNARPFYIELCWKCQKYTDYENWQKHKSQKMDILFEVLWRDPWEPFYISVNTVPYYDERFRQYGFNRISQVCELHMSGYKFSVLNKAFVIHKGFKTADSFHKEKDLELERNRILFRQFKTQLKDKYPESSRRCY
ncbi:beta-1,4-glucuronyltransferase 1-like [Oppia nitens]|uniref:beta-1,4-glucuronyltransferase 1-like n=1 Tax=Oppia nitens TaxID=1686743 RepID=UPI0023DB1DD0|nr:beta-1,4-glucuronyltransferase 1-like [Oppia nitens]